MRKLPRLIMSITIAVIFLAMTIVVPPLVGEVTVPGISVSGGYLLWAGLMLITVIFLIRALADALSFADILTDIFVRSLGVKEDRPLKRAARDVIYIIVTVLLAEAVLPIVTSCLKSGVSLQVQ